MSHRLGRRSLSTAFAARPWQRCDQIAAEAGVPLTEAQEFFADAEAVLMAIVDELSRTTAAALQRVPSSEDPEHALLAAGTEALDDVVAGRNAVSLDQLLTMARVVAATRNLQRTVSARRKRVMAQALADWMGVGPQDRRLQRALTMWSAVTASAYVGALDLPERYRSKRDTDMRQRMVANLMQTFGEVMGDDPASF